MLRPVSVPRLLAALCLALSIALSAHAQQRKINVKQEFDRAGQQLTRLLQTHPDVTKFPYSSKPDGSLKDTPSEWWTSGFFGGTLWYMFEYTKQPQWQQAADRWTMAMAQEQTNTGTHDLGFMLYCPFGNGLRLTQNPAYKPVLLTGAKSLATRFNPEVGLIKSWNNFQGYKYPVIIDNMMNLELLCWAARTTGDSTLRRLSITHADNTLRNHFRPDGSTYHVVCYDEHGQVLAKKTAQGAADNSAWARGQAWAIYGYTTMFRDTKLARYQEQARKTADFFLNHPNLPADKIPYWDFNAPNIPQEERDASAAAIVASALLELQQYCPAADAKRYRKAAEQMLVSLSSPTYRAAVGENNNFLIKHCVAHKPAKTEVDAPLTYADYYYLEALLRYNQLK
ncbi:glucuronyl hydrolase [Hymenobacter taeanensis]|uniref:Glucuronyl hydrolase n=1 Tax=Hymenobacter taeanensis TaxID=2735321 RepID=A0A6M6BH56_9BACT|nr:MULTISPECIES: glycoside hydrolase family 88 protein [Hymenobacter]QJX46593.1 glucuronyl hydrolase [Hymenobacter taeanensis]UOQ80453.1 glycoside hydrolase family 88 protein [Hymenobacter sp. 5414T-23]